MWCPGLSDVSSLDAGSALGPSSMGGGGIARILSPKSFSHKTEAKDFRLGFILDLHLSSVMALDVLPRRMSTCCMSKRTCSDDTSALGLVKSACWHMRGPEMSKTSFYINQFLHLRLTEMWVSFFFSLSLITLSSLGRSILLRKIVHYCSSLIFRHTTVYSVSQ